MLTQTLTLFRRVCGQKTPKDADPTRANPPLRQLTRIGIYGKMVAEKLSFEEVDP